MVEFEINIKQSTINSKCLTAGMGLEKK